MGRKEKGSQAEKTVCSKAGGVFTIFAVTTLQWIMLYINNYMDKIKT